jgi:hypothetical protein
MLMVVCLVFGFDVHLNSQTGSGEKNGIEVCCKLACVSHLIVNVLISDPEHMLNGEILFRGFVVSSGVASLFEMARLLNLPSILWICAHTLTFCLFKAIVFLTLRLLIFLDEILCVIDFIRVILPHNDGFFLSTNADKIFAFFLFFFY